MDVIVPLAIATHLAHVAKALYDRGWMEGTSGNLSVRLDDGKHALITASGRGKGALTHADMVPVSIATGEPAGEGYSKASAETSIHLALYRSFPDVGAVVHAHPPYSTVLASGSRAAGEGYIRFERFEIIKGFGQLNTDKAEVPVFHNWPNVPDIAREIAKHFRRKFLANPRHPSF